MPAALLVAQLRRHLLQAADSGRRFANVSDQPEAFVDFTFQTATCDRCRNLADRSGCSSAENVGTLPASERGVELGDHGAEPDVQEIRNTQPTPMHAKIRACTEANCIFYSRPPLPSLAERLWEHLNRLDASIAASPPASVGTAVGDRLQVQRWTAPSGGFFAAQVLDTETTSLWELFHIPSSERQSVAGRRICFETAAGAQTIEAAWQAVFIPLLGEVAQGAHCPSFVEIVAAGSSPAGVTAIREETAQIANLQADLEYWSQLARSLSKAQRSTIAQQDAPPAAQAAQELQGTEAAKEWRLREIDLWALANEHRITILPRAIAATKRSPYENHHLLYDCLELLATEYTQVKIGKLDRFAFKQKADAMGLEYGGSVAPSNAGEYGDQYFIRWRGRRRFLDQHLSKGNARDPRFCLRLYYTWDDVAQRVLVGSMPAHLGTSGT